MDNSALYCTIENGRQRYFISRYAGGFSYPLIVFNTADTLSKNMNKTTLLKVCGYADLLPIMAANEMFPMSGANTTVFYEKDESDFRSKANRFGIDDDYSFLITLDFDKREIGYRFNLNALGFDLDDVTISADDPVFAKLFCENISDPNQREIMFHDLLKAHAGQEKIIKATVMEVLCECRAGKFVLNLPLQENSIQELKSQFLIDDIDAIKVGKVCTDLKYLNSVTECKDKTLSSLNEIAVWACEQRMQKHADAHPLKVFAAVLESTDTHSMTEMLDITILREYNRQ